MSRKRSERSVLIVALAIVGCAQADQEATEEAAVEAGMEQVAPNTLTDRERQEGWRLLFDGRTTNGWRGYKQQTIPPGWEVVDGALTRVGPTTDIITSEQFRNFDLVLEWRTVAGGNSGIFFRAIEGDGAIYEYAPEVQVLDDAGHPDGQSELTSAGSNFALHPAPRGVAHPAGEWNAVHLLVEGNRVRQWMNGQPIVDYEIGSEDWKRRVAASKFAAWPQYGLAPQGHVGLQEHQSEVAFRSIKIRVLP